jgi:hypothetical protein
MPNLASQWGKRMKPTTDTKQVQRLQRELALERQKRLELAQKLGGVNSLNGRLKAALMASRAELAKLKAPHAGSSPPGT